MVQRFNLGATLGLLGLGLQVAMASSSQDHNSTWVKMST
jgi:hypothetical protein